MAGTATTVPPDDSFAIGIRFASSPAPAIFPWLGGPSPARGSQMGVWVRVAEIGSRAIGMRRVNATRAELGRESSVHIQAGTCEEVCLDCQFELHDHRPVRNAALSQFSANNLAKIWPSLVSPGLFVHPYAALTARFSTTHPSAASIGWSLRPCFKLIEKADSGGVRWQGARGARVVPGARWDTRTPERRD